MRRTYSERKILDNSVSFLVFDCPFDCVDYLLDLLPRVRDGSHFKRGRLARHHAEETRSDAFEVLLRLDTKCDLLSQIDHSSLLKF